MNLMLNATQSTPSISADWDSGVLSMTGDSYPENAFEMYSDVIQWVERFLSDKETPLNLELSLLYLNTSSIKSVMDIFDLLEEAFQNDRAVSVHWYYEESNERVSELAEEFKEDCTFPFHILEK